ncbi:AlbA family DNA-binding domain-containing protein [Cumulibacter manganitolerans]|uniref:AlbA family DNA-binding domain-containing protein n=1 Tax=Cumulibacter manganitolerans TaxID=1884992 RepID=UPI001E35C89B|nr:ATP-binding protein [Cumulibacter manganitolerans]
MYLSSDQPHWDPRTEADLRSAIDNELLHESHHLDLKRQPGKGSREANQEHARDLAQFAIDGGQLIYGIKEGANGQPHTLFPIELAGLAERIEQIALAAVDPPLQVSCRPITSEQDPSKGYLIVEIPISTFSPHMVDGRYLGRGDKMRRYLSDTEVVRLHQLRTLARDEAGRVLDDYVSRDPIPVDRRRLAHFFVVACPARPRHEEMLLDHVDGDWGPVVNAVLQAAFRDPLYAQGPRFKPSIGDTHQFQRRADGIARTAKLSSDRTLGNPNDEKYVIELELAENGAVRLFTARLSDHLTEDPVEGRTQIIADVLVDHVRHVLTMARHISELVGYRGAWHIGVAATGIAGLRAHTSQLLLSPLPPYPADRDEYRRTATVSFLDLQKTPGIVTGQLVGQLLRALRVEAEYEAYLRDATAESGILND